MRSKFAKRSRSRAMTGAAYPLHRRRSRADSHLVDGALARDLDRARRTRAAPRRAPSRRRARRRCASARAAARRQRAACSPASPAVRCPRGPSRLGRRQRRLEEQQVGRRAAKSSSASVGPWSAPKVKRPPRRAAHLDGVGGHVVRDGLEAQAQRADAGRLRRGRTRRSRRRRRAGAAGRRRRVIVSQERRRAAAGRAAAGGGPPSSARAGRRGRAGRRSARTRTGRGRRSDRGACA